MQKILNFSNILTHFKTKAREHLNLASNHSTDALCVARKSLACERTRMAFLSAILTMMRYERRANMNSTTAIVTAGVF